MKRLFLLILVMSIFIVNVCSAMQVKMLNIGQGDSILIQSDNKNILIDTGDAKDRDKLIAELQKAGVTKIDTLILSHAHADHIGNSNYVIRTYGVNSVYDNGFTSSSRYYKNYINAINELGVNYGQLQLGDNLLLDYNLTFEVVYPSEDYDIREVNNQSIVGRLVFGKFRMLFTGDAEFPAETDILYSDSNIAAAVLKSAHHGSKSSSLFNFVEAVHPAYVLISAGVNNKFGHPHPEPVYSYLAAGVPAENIFCTAFNGTITIDCDGNNFSITPERVNVWANNYVNGRRVTVTKARRIG